MPITGKFRPGARLAVVAMLVAACGSPTVTPPPAATPAPTRDARIEEIGEGRGVWERRRPGTAAYTTVESWAGLSATAVRVTEMDGRAETQAVEVGPNPVEVGAGQAIDALFDRALAAIGREGATVEIAYDTTYGYVAKLDEAMPDVADSGTSVQVRDFTTPADRTGAARARDALDDVLLRWQAPASPTWGYTWSRYSAADTPATAATVRVHHEGDATTLAAEDGGAGDGPPPTEATIQGTVDAAIGVLAAGGWVDVAIDPEGLDTLVAIDPSPSATGDGFWIRIDYTDLYLERAREALAAARTRWGEAGVDRYRYRMTFESADATWTWRVSMDSGVARVKAGRGAPPVADAFVGPGVDPLFELVEGRIASGGRVAVTYDKALGHPETIRILSGDGDAPKGVLTISRFRTP